MSVVSQPLCGIEHSDAPARPGAREPEDRPSHASATKRAVFSAHGTGITTFSSLINGQNELVWSLFSVESPRRDRQVQYVVRRIALPPEQAHGACELAAFPAAESLTCSISRVARAHDSTSRPRPHTCTGLLWRHQTGDVAAGCRCRDQTGEAPCRSGTGPSGGRSWKAKVCNLRQRRSDQQGTEPSA